MAKIKNLAFLRKSSLKKMTTFIESGANGLTPFIVDFFHHFLPLRLKFLEESFVATQDKQIKGLISLKVAKGNYERFKITRLLLEQDSFEIGSQLIDYVSARYSAMGATSFYVVFDQSHQEMKELFSNECGFRLLAYEILYKCTKKDPSNSDFSNFRIFKNSDAKTVCELYNSSILAQYKASLMKKEKSFCESLFKGLNKTYSISYILEKSNKKGIMAYLNLTSYDNRNFVLSLNTYSAFNSYLDEIIDFALTEIKKRTSDYTLFIKLSTFFESAKDYEQILKDNNFEQVQKQIVLIKDFYKPIKDTGFLKNSRIIFNDIQSSPAFQVEL